LSFRYCDLYRVRGEFSFFDDGVRIFKAAAIGSLLIVAAAFLYRGGFTFRAFSYARGVFVADFLFRADLVGALRFFMRAVQTLVRSRQDQLDSNPWLSDVVRRRPYL
jgi:FlaA1/EpsC-like NDP-sugar epimerase